MSVQTGRMVSANEARRFLDQPAVRHVVDDYLTDLAYTIVTQAEQIAAALALHDSLTCEFEGYPRWTCRRSKRLRERDWCTKCRLAEALGVSGE